MKRCDNIDERYTHMYTIDYDESNTSTIHNILKEIPQFRDGSTAEIYDNGYIKISYKSNSDLIHVCYNVLDEEKEGDNLLDDIYPDIDILKKYNKISTPALVRRVNLGQDKSTNNIIAIPDYSIIIGNNIYAKIDADKISVLKDDGTVTAVSPDEKTGFFIYDKNSKIIKLIYSYKQSYIIDFYNYNQVGGHKEKKVEYYKYNNNDTDEKGYILDLGNIENDIGGEFIPKYLEVR